MYTNCKNFSVDDMKRIGLRGCGYHSGVDYNAIAVVDILEILNYLMEKNGIV